MFFLPKFKDLKFKKKIPEMDIPCYSSSALVSWAQMIPELSPAAASLP